MSTPFFSPCDPSTWPMTLVADQVAAIYQRKVGGIRKAVQLRAFVPAPMLDADGSGKVAHPLRWRRVDVERHVLGARSGSSLRKVG